MHNDAFAKAAVKILLDQTPYHFRCHDQRWALIARLILTRESGGDSCKQSSIGIAELKKGGGSEP